MLPPSPQKGCSPPKKKMGKRECLIAGDHYAIAAIECLPGSARFVDPVFGQLHVLGQSNFYPYKFFLGRGQATLQVKVFSWSTLFWQPTILIYTADIDTKNSGDHTLPAMPFVYLIRRT